MKTLFAVTWWAFLAAVVSVGAELGEESGLVAVLQSGASPAAKEDACRRLKQIGTAGAVPALANLLASEQLFQAACDALETMPVNEAGAALQAALKTTTGKPKAGIIHALGERRHRAAVSELAALLGDRDTLVAGAAARALGNIGTAEATRALRENLLRATTETRPALVDALLQGASRFIAETNRAEATAIYTLLSGPNEKEQVRTAAFAGLIRLAGAQALTLVSSALEGNDEARQIAALQLARELSDPKATEAFTDLLAKTSPAMRIALLGLLQQRGDSLAAPAVLALARNEDSAVRVAAISALGTLGDATAIPVLASSAASSSESEQKAARAALIQLQRGKVGDAMVAQLAAASPAEQVELIGALTARSEKSAVPKLLELARTGQDSARRAAVRALQKLADGSHIPVLVELLEAGRDETIRAAIQNVFESVADRVAETGKPDVTAIVKGLAGADSQARIALLPVGAFFPDEGIRAALRKSVSDGDAQVRQSALRALCNSRDVELMPDQLELARASGDFTLRVLALEGYVRLVNGEGTGFSEQKRAGLLGPAYGLATRAEEKRLILSALAAVAHRDALALTDRAWSDDGVKTEAEIASLQIAKALISTEPSAASSLQRLATNAVALNVRTNAQAILRQYGSGWLCSGPYRQEGKQYRELFDIPFAPEQLGGRNSNWRLAPGSGSSPGGCELDLKTIVGGDQCVVYVKTRVFVTAAQAVNLEIGSDDGIKLWVNGTLVHANNTARPLTPGQDHAKADLHAGGNDLLAKITQNNAGCGMSLRITDAKGAAIPELRFDPRDDSRPPDYSAFDRIKLSDRFYAEGAYYGDFNRDGHLDIVAGPFWFAGPDFKEKHEIRPPKEFDPKDYSDNFLTYTADFNGDGWPDVFCVPYPGKEGYWFENPGTKDGHWKRHLAYPMIGNESPGWYDVDGDGRPDLVFNNDGCLGYLTFDPAKPDDTWVFHAVSMQDKRFQRFTHGVGVGDINGDGRMDIVEAAGWWEQPVDAKTSGPWEFHAFQFAEAGSQMLVTDVDGDGLADVITSWHCHHYGLVWHRQVRDADGTIKWQRNVILPPEPDLKRAELRISQMHAMALVDMNGDGLKDIVTGKRYWAHGPTGDVEPDAPAVLCWFELVRKDGRANFIPHLIDDDSGVGTQVTAVDLNGDQRPDVIVANKHGIFVYLSKAAGR